MIKKRSILFIIACLITAFCLAGCSGEGNEDIEKLTKKLMDVGKLSSSEDINLRSDNGSDYYFTYDGEDYYTDHWEDHWIIYDSYKITSMKDMTIICQALIDEHPIHGSDMESYRTAKDMAFEWEQHNIAYEQLPEGNSWREHAKNVDLDPADQGRTFKEIYEDRTGEKIDLDKILDNKDKIKEKLKEKLKEELDKME